MKPKGQIPLPESGICSCSYFSELYRIRQIILLFSHCFLAQPVFPPEYMVNPEYLEREPPKVYPGCSGVYPYHSFPMGFAINESPPGISLQRGFRHIPSNSGPGKAASVSVSSNVLITCGSMAVFNCLPPPKVPMKSYPAYQLLHSILMWCVEEKMNKW